MPNDNINLCTHRLFMNVQLFVNYLRTDCSAKHTHTKTSHPHENRNTDWMWCLRTSTLPRWWFKTGKMNRYGYTWREIISILIVQINSEKCFLLTDLIFVMKGRRIHHPIQMHLRRYPIVKGTCRTNAVLPRNEVVQVWAIKKKCAHVMRYDVPCWHLKVPKWNAC